MERVADVMQLWPSVPEFCSDLGITVQLARVWKHRAFIPPEWWAQIEESARRRSIAGATASDLARAAASRRGEGRSGPTVQAA